MHRGQEPPLHTFYKSGRRSMATSSERTRQPLVTLRPHPDAMAVNPFNYLPRPVKLQRVVTRPPPPPPNPFAPSDPFAFAEACVSKGAVSAVAGGVMGALMGLLMGSYQSISPPVPLPGVPDPPSVPIRWLCVFLVV